MIRPLILVIASVFSLIDLFAQDGAADSTAREIFSPVEQSAQFPGGMAKFYKYIGDNLKYPAAARKNKISGKVLLRLLLMKMVQLMTIVL